MRMPLPPPPADGLISSGKPTSRARSMKLFGSSSSIAEGATGKPCFGDKRAGADLVAHQLDRVHGRPDEGDAGRFDRAGEIGVLGQKAIARMNGVGAGGRCRGDDLLALEIGGDRTAARDLDGAVGKANRRTCRIHRVVNDDALDAEIVQRAQDAYRDLAAIGDQDTAEGRRFCHEAIAVDGWRQAPARAPASCVSTERSR